MREYDDSPAILVRGIQDRGHRSAGDPAKMAARIIASAEVEPAPLRVVLGSDSYWFIVGTLRERLAEVEAQADSALNTDWSDD